MPASTIAKNTGGIFGQTLIFRLLKCVFFVFWNDILSDNWDWVSLEGMVHTSRASSSLCTSQILRDVTTL